MEAYTQSEGKTFEGYGLDCNGQRPEVGCSKPHVRGACAAGVREMELRAIECRHAAGYTQADFRNQWIALRSLGEERLIEA